MKFKRPEPTLVIQFASSMVILLATFGWDALTPTQAGVIVAAIAAVAAAVNAIFVRPVAVPVFAGAVNALLAVAAGWGLKMAPETAGALTAVLVNLLAFLGTRDQGTPVSDPQPGGGVSADMAAAIRTKRAI